MWNYLKIFVMALFQFLSQISGRIYYLGVAVHVERFIPLFKANFADGTCLYTSMFFESVWVLSVFIGAREVKFQCIAK